MAVDVKEALRNELITQEIVREPATAGDFPPCWIEPRNGVPAPGEISDGGKPAEKGDTLVLGLLHGGGIPLERYVSRWMRDTLVDVHVRAKAAPDAFDIEKAIRQAINEKMNWSMGGLQIIESQIFREMQPLKRDAQAFTYVLTYRFEHYVDPPFQPPV